MQLEFRLVGKKINYILQEPEWCENTPPLQKKKKLCITCFGFLVIASN